MGILEGKKILVTGVLTEASIAFTAAKLAQEEGAEVLLSSDYPEDCGASSKAGQGY